MTGNRVGLVSFVRSGNTFLKKFIERIIGVTTGGELKRDILLQCAGIMGEGHAANDRVFISKSHHPMAFKRSKEGEEDGYCSALKINKQIFLMRSPIDNLLSTFYLFIIRSHSLTAANNLKEEFPVFWGNFVRRMS